MSRLLLSVSELFRRFVDGAIKGAGMGIFELTNTYFFIFVFSIYIMALQIILNAFFINGKQICIIMPSLMSILNDLIQTLTTIHDENVEKWTEGGCVNPLFQLTFDLIIATVDMSGSMGNVMKYAMMMGIMVTLLNKLHSQPHYSFLTFSSSPRWISLGKKDPATGYPEGLYL